ncbi:MAG: response regulator [Bacteroidota bacterium]
MKRKKQIFKIVVLEDSSFYNNILTRQLEYYTNAIAMDKKCEFNIQSFTSSVDFVRNLQPDIDIAFVDYYLGNGVTGSQIIREIKKVCKNCKIIIISQSRSMRTGTMTLTEGAKDYIYKDKHALSKSCFIVEDIVNDRLMRSP